MQRRIHGEDADHPDIAVSLHELGRVLQQKEGLEGSNLCSVRVHVGEDRIYGVDSIV